MRDQIPASDERCRDLEEARSGRTHYSIVLLPEVSVVACTDYNVVYQALLVHLCPYSLVMPKEDCLYDQIARSEHRSPDLAVPHSLTALLIIEESLPFWTGEPDAVD